MDTPNRVRVIAVLPKINRSWLVQGAEAFRNDEPFESPPDARLPQGFEPDRQFHPVPLGPVDPREFRYDHESPPDVRYLEPTESNFFAIRGFVEAETPASVPNQIDDLQLYSDPRTCALLTCGTDPAVGSIDDARTKLDVQRLAANGLDGNGVAVAMVDSGIFLEKLTGVLAGGALLYYTRPHPRFPLPPTPTLDGPNSWKPLQVATPPGKHRIGHGTMCAYNVLAVAPKATLLDYPMLITRPPGDHTVTGTVSAALQAYIKLYYLWINMITVPIYKALVVNNSWGIFHPCMEEFPPGNPNRFIDNFYHPLHLLVWVLAFLGVDIVFSAGNGGLPCPAPPFLHLTTGSIRGANAYPEVLTVAGCDINDSRVGYSSQGPAISMFPAPTPLKPDLTAYTHFLGSQVRGEREPDLGTSTACPIAAGCVAALRTMSTTSPANLFATLRATARKPAGTATPWNPDYGYGIIDPVAAGRALGIIP
jgi:hypothetical protein